MAKPFNPSSDDDAEVIGEVFEADIQLRRFQVRTDSGDAVAVSFRSDQEPMVTSALKDHLFRRMKVRGRVVYSANGKIERFRSVDNLELMNVDEAGKGTHSAAIEDELARIAAEVPDEEWKKLPSDLSDRLDDYLYRGRE